MATAPTVAVGAIVIDEGDLLLVRRDREPAKGCWSLPGGKLELGESLEEALRREVLEETGLRIEPRGVAGFAERIIRGDDGAVTHHFVIVDYWASTPERKPPVAQDDASEARWVPAGDVRALTLPPGLADFLDDRGALRGRLPHGV